MLILGQTVRKVKRDYNDRVEYAGIVERSSGRGRMLGFPTANIHLSDAEPSGIYAARATFGDTTYIAAAFADQERHILEAHLLDFSGDLYGKEVRIELLAKIRDAEWFVDDGALVRVIAKDVAKIREYFQNH